MRFLVPISFAFMLLPVPANPQQKESRLTHHAHGTFTVNVQPLTPPPAEGLGRYSINKVIELSRFAAARALRT